MPDVLVCIGSHLLGFGLCFCCCFVLVCWALYWFVLLVYHNHSLCRHLMFLCSLVEFVLLIKFNMV